MKKFSTSISHKIKFTRLYLGLSIEDIASRCHVDTHVICRWELGLSNPDAAARSEIAKAFGLTLDEFEFGELTYVTPEIANA